ncbi:nuclear transport factor 2 family protein [Fulvivirga sp. RKSG066]|uniref:nuclear transport factor 2 family protein n=1 Tax=Fulvivirga aurantia TaxID=2529383 RepID=UPI0012BBEB7A|nr:nuclear transport factor 2 family protein [Fulvivirga aurantia]MTI20697.1 nuclear transport factor 2 family protein [Fulvivirga aurantia]
MKYSIYLTFVLALFGCSHSSMELEKSTHITENDVKELMKKWELAYQQRDTVLFREVLDDSYQYSGNVDGTSVDKHGMINELATAGYTFLSINFTDFSIDYYEDIAIIRGREAINLLIDQDTATFHLRFTDVYQKRNGKTQAIATHSSPIEN